MKQYIIKGGTPLSGEVTIGGAKMQRWVLSWRLLWRMSQLQLIIYRTLMTSGLLDAIESIGAIVERIDSHTVRINGACINDVSIDEDAIRKIRGSYYLVGALLGKYKKL